MSTQKKCRVIGLTDHGEQIAITHFIPRSQAEKIIELIEDNTPFAKLSLECQDATGPSS